MGAPAAGKGRRGQVDLRKRGRGGRRVALRQGSALSGEQGEVAARAG